jgi:alkylation response protein AidB-like acyl-CoA dehydrogenase
MYLQSAWLMAMKAAELYDNGRPCAAEANAAKFLGARASHDAAWQAMMTHGGFGYAKEYHGTALPRGFADAARADQRATHHVFHRRESARPAPELLRKEMAVGRARRRQAYIFRASLRRLISARAPSMLRFPLTLEPAAGLVV